MSEFCIGCGSPLKPEAKFCGSCGTIVQRTQTKPTTAAGRNPDRWKKLLIPGIAVLTVLIVLAIAVPLVIKTIQERTSVSIDSIGGQPYTGRAITIYGEGFGYFNPQNSTVSIDGINAPIVTWGESEVTAVVPTGISTGKKEIQLANPPFFNKKSIKKEFVEHTKTEIARATLTPSEETYLEGKEFVFIAPAGSVAEELEIIIYQYDSPSLDENPYYRVTDEYEISGSDGGHVFFDQLVYFGLNAADEEEAFQSAYQIFDEYMGHWVKSETVYNREDGRLFLVTDHFSGFRKFVSEMYKGAGRFAGQKVEAGKKSIEYIYQEGKAAKDAVVKLTEAAHVMVKDALTEEFVGVSDADQKFIIYYRASDAAEDPSIPENARLMAAAFSTAYAEYQKLFGEDKLKRFYADPAYGSNSRFGPTSRLMKMKLEIVPDTIQVYIDPRYNKDGAKASIISGNIIMPSDYYGESLAVTCAHELFHLVQYYQLGVKQIYMANNLIELNNKWFLEATAEYAGRFVGTSLGVGEPIHKSIDASKAYYAFSGAHVYGISSFLDYIITSRQTDEGARKEGFREMWNYVVENYSPLQETVFNLDIYVEDKLNDNTQNLYEEFWRDAYTRIDMPEADNIAGGLTDINSIAKAKINSKLEIEENGIGIFRYRFDSRLMFKDDTALTRSFWLHGSPATIIGDVYRLAGLDMADRVSGKPPFAGAINISDKAVQDVLVPYAVGDSFALVAVVKSSPAKSANAQLTLSATSVKWDNQKDIEKKLGNSTLARGDKLKFTPVLPEQKADDPPFTAVVTLNNSEDYLTEIDKVENGKSFEVDAPMKELPPDKVSANIKILRDGKLVHEYQSGELAAEVSVYISGPRDVVIELTKEELPYEHDYTAKAWPVGEYRFAWSFGNGFEKETKGKEESAVSTTYLEFGEYTTKVTLYDLNGKMLASHDVTLTLKDKNPSSTTSSKTLATSGGKYAWVLTEIVDYENADRWEIANAHPSYIYNYGYSRGSYSASVTYEGDDRDRSGTFGLKAVFTGVPDIIYPDQAVSLHFSFTVTENSLVNLGSSGGASANFDEWDASPYGITRDARRFTAGDGKDSFTIDAINGPFSYSEKLTASLGSGRKEGDRIALRTRFSLAAAMGTNYVYEWKPVG